MSKQLRIDKALVQLRNRAEQEVRVLAEEIECASSGPLVWPEAMMNDTDTGFRLNFAVHTQMGEDAFNAHARKPTL